MILKSNAFCFDFSTTDGEDEHLSLEVSTRDEGEYHLSDDEDFGTPLAR